MDTIPTTFAEVIGLWKSAAELARELNVQDITVRAWKRRDMIPAEYWSGIEQSAQRNGCTQVTVKVLAEIAARQAGRGVSDVVAQGATQEAGEAA